MDLNWKLQKIRSMDSELNEVHPMLLELFNRMTGIKEVQYTQGNRENGADFVLTKVDSLLGLDEYVGVVVKSSQIKQNSDDVFRQVEECTLVARPADNGKKSIYISEVWVVTTKDITRNAEDILHAKYKNTKIKFIDVNGLVRLTDLHFPKYWEVKSLNVNRYVEEQRRNLSSSSELHRLVPAGFSRISVDYDLITNPAENKRKFGAKRQKPTNLWEELEKNKFIFIEGGMGSGKSDLLRTTALKLCDLAASGKTNKVPHYLTYRELIKKPDFEIFLEELEKNINDEIEKVVVFVDGLDESLEEATAKVSRICELASKIHQRQNFALVVASRDIEEESLNTDIRSFFDKYTIRHLTFNAIIKFVERICTNGQVSAKLKDDLQNSPLMRALPRTPLSAILLGKLLKENINELPATLPELYSKYVELVLGRWDIQKNGGSEKEYETIQRLTSLVATYFLDNDLEVLGVNELRSTFKAYLEERRTGQSLEPMLESFIRKSELISYDDDAKVVAFKHKSFAEFFYAQAMLLEKGKSADFKMPFSPNWAGIEYFYLGLVRDAPERIKKLSALIPSDANEEFIKFSQFGAFLMAAYQTPYETIITSLYDRFLDAAKNYTGVIRREKLEVLKAFPELQVLSLFTQLLRRGYAYEFFRPALQEARIQAELDNGLSEEEKIIFIFFVDAVLAELKDPSAFEALVDRHEASINWTIRLGIYYASSDVSLVNNATKAIGRKIERSTKGNQKLIEYFRVLENIPLQERKNIGGK